MANILSSLVNGVKGGVKGALSGTADLGVQLLALLKILQSPLSKEPLTW